MPHPNRHSTIGGGVFYRIRYHNNNNKAVLFEVSHLIREGLYCISSSSKKKKKEDPPTTNKYKIFIVVLCSIKKIKYKRKI